MGEMLKAPWWLPGGNAQTIWPALYAHAPSADGLAWQRQRWTAPDGDFIDLDFLRPSERKDREPTPLLVLFHGLEGSSASPYARSFGHVAQTRGWEFVVPHFRGCSGEINLSPRAYHSGDYEEIDWILGRLKSEEPGRPMMAIGISLGGNALMRWAQEAGTTAAHKVSAVAAVSSPLDLAASGAAIDRGFNRWVYARMFLKTMRQKAETKWQQFPGLFDLDRVRRATTLFEFDDVFTGPLHGFAGTHDYWSNAAAKPRLRDMRIPALALNALNDPFVPADSLPQAQEVGPYVTLWQPKNGGHVGFCASSSPFGWPGHVMAMPLKVCDWLAQSLPIRPPSLATGENHG